MPAADKILLNYDDGVLWSSDVELLRGNCFLNDRLIDFFFAQLTVPHHVLLFPPAISFWICHCPDMQSLVSTSEQLRLTERQVIMCAVNDNEDLDLVGGGSHWSLLVYIRECNKFEHYDSLGGVNAEHAKRLVSIIKKLLGPDAQSAKYKEAWTPRQVNGYDCGLYVMAIAEVFCQAYASRGSMGSVSNRRDLISEKVTPSVVSELRATVSNLILSRAEEYQRSKAASRNLPV